MSRYSKIKHQIKQELDYIQEFNSILKETMDNLEKITEPPIEEKRDKILEELLKPTILNRIKNIFK